MSTRTRTIETIESSIAIDALFNVIYNAVIVSTKVQWSAIPATSEDFQVWRRRAGTQDFLMMAANPADRALISYGNTDRHEIVEGDQIRVVFPNTDLRDVSVELMFEQT